MSVWEAIKKIKEILNKAGLHIVDFNLDDPWDLKFYSVGKIEAMPPAKVTLSFRVIGSRETLIKWAESETEKPLCKENPACETCDIFVDCGGQTKRLNNYEKITKLIHRIMWANLELTKGPTRAVIVERIIEHVTDAINNYERGMRT